MCRTLQALCSLLPDVTHVIRSPGCTCCASFCAGVDVKLQLQPASHAVARIESAEQLSMQQLLEEYAANTGMSQDVLDLARGALQVRQRRHTKQHDS
jgi:hypothetical protein